MKISRLSAFMLAMAMAFVLLFAGCSAQEQSGDVPEAEETAGTEETAEKSIDYMLLVNKENYLPEGWEESLELASLTNSVGDEVLVEKKAYEAYCGLKDALEEEGVYIELDSAYRSVEAQQKIWDDFMEKYGEEYTRTYVAVPGTSEHQTGLALDLYFRIDGKDIYENEDLVQYPEIWEKIWEKLPDYGFILRYPKGKEDVTGCAFEEWHIRYLDSPEIAKEIMDNNSTLEEYLGKPYSGN